MVKCCCLVGDGGLHQSDELLILFLTRRAMPLMVFLVLRGLRFTKKFHSNWCETVGGAAEQIDTQKCAKMLSSAITSN